MSFFVSPTSTKEGIERAFETSTAFVYGVANVGLTGDIPSMDRGIFFEVCRITECVVQSLRDSELPRLRMSMD